MPCLLQCEGAPPCTELNDGAGEQTKALLDNMDRSCTTDSDCVIQVYHGSCTLSPCGGAAHAAMSSSELVRVPSELQEIQAKYCQPYDSAGCHDPPSECPFPVQYIYSALCESGECKLHYTRAPDR